MELTNKQAEGLKIAVQRYRAGDKYTVISGYAGSGKSTLVRFIIEALDVDRTKVCYAAYTGKAAEVLRKKGNSNAITLHKLLYDSIPMPGGGFLRKPKSDLEYNIVVVDEVSMVPKDMVEILKGHQVYVIYLGDPFQLPPIDKQQDNGLLDSPHVFLDEVMRQAAESEIIQVTMKIRAGEILKPFNGKEVKIVTRPELTTGMFSWADQIICGTNNTRTAINNQMRAMLGYSGLPQDGEKMICLRNYWDIISSNGDSLVNGTTGTISVPKESEIKLPRAVKCDNRNLQTILANFITEDYATFEDIHMDKEMIVNGQKCIDWRVAYQLGKLKKNYGDLEPKEFAFAYAITCHKSQGSEWDDVLVIEERFPFDKLEHAKWLYTAATRAAKRLVLVLD